MWGRSPPRHRDSRPIRKWTPVDCGSSEADADALALPAGLNETIAAAAAAAAAAAVVAAVVAVAAAVAAVAVEVGKRKADGLVSSVGGSCRNHRWQLEFHR